MTTDDAVDAIPADPSIEGSALIAPDLAEAAAGEYLAANGWTALTTRPVQFMYRPGRRMTVRRTAWVERDGRNRRLSVVTESRRRPYRTSPAGTPTDDLPTPVMTTDSLRTWGFPHDPYLPELHRALTIDGAREIAESVTGWPASVRSSVVRYRPGKRAVLRYEVRPRGQGRAEPLELFVKIMRPQAADRVEVATADPPSAPSISTPAARPFPGTLVFTSVAGSDMRRALLEGGHVPDPVAFAGLVDEFSAWDDPGTPGPGRPEDRLTGTVDLLGIVLPNLEGRVRRFDEEVRERLHPIAHTTVHGDMHEGQVIIDPTGALVVLDVDDIGPGDPVMDAANALAHLRALAESHPSAAGRLLEYRSDLRSAYLAGNRDGSDLDTREAIAMLQLAGGPLRVLSENWPQRVEARLAVAERVLAGEAAG